MKQHLTVFACVLLTALTARAQQLNNVTFTPNNPTECQTVDLVFYGSMPENGNFLYFVPPPPNNDTLLLKVYAGGGMNGNDNFAQPLPGMGPYAPANYLFIVQFYYINQGDTNLADVWSSPLIVSVGTNPYAGEFNDTTICMGADNFPLIDVLLGNPDPGGVWYDPYSEVVPNGILDPGQYEAGLYSYVFDLNPPCLDASQYIIVAYSDTVNAGLNVTIQSCADGSGEAFSLFDTLGGFPDPGGTWAFNGAPHSGTFVPGVDVCGVYTYTVLAEAPCGNPTGAVTIQCVNPPSAGNNATQPVNLCYNDSSQVLQGYITGEPNTGQWIDPDNGFGIGPFNAPINVALYGPGDYGYVVYSSGGVCPNDTSFVTVVLWGDTIVGCTIGMSEVDGNVQRFELSPNPAQNEVTIELELGHAATGHVLDILDVNGSVVRSEALNFSGTLARRTISLGDLARGAYTVRVTSSEGRAVRRLMLR